MRFHWRAMIVSIVFFAMLLSSMGTGQDNTQDPFREPKNLKVFPSSIKRDSLVSVMRGFSFALSVRCQYCHVGGDGVSLEGVEFERDDNPNKEKARFMLRMVDRLNSEILPQMPGRGRSHATIQCKTCHRGLEKPMLLRQEVRRVLESSGADSAVAYYRYLRGRENIVLAGMFDFTEWEMNTLAEDLAAEGRKTDAIAMFRLNEEFFGRSVSIKIQLARLYEDIGKTNDAIAYYEKVLELRPDHQKSRERLESLRHR